MSTTPMSARQTPTGIGRGPFGQQYMAPPQREAEMQRLSEVAASLQQRELNIHANGRMLMDRVAELDAREAALSRREAEEGAALASREKDVANLTSMLAEQAFSNSQKFQGIENALLTLSQVMEGRFQNPPMAAVVPPMQPMRQVEATSSAASSTPAVKVERISLSELPKFSGDITQTDIWLRAIKAAFFRHSIKEDRLMLAYLPNALQGEAGQWYESQALNNWYCETSEGSYALWSEFELALKSTFVNQLTPEVARMAFKRLLAEKDNAVKTAEIPAFISEFRRLMTLVGDRSHNDLKSDFISCMMKDARSYLINKEVDKDTLENLIVAAANYSSRSAAYNPSSSKGTAAGQSGSSGSKSSWRFSNHQSGQYHQPSQSTPMELGVISKEKLPTFLGVEEAKVLANFEQGLCLYCGKDNHYVGVCRSLIRDHPKHPAIQTRQGNGGRGGRGPGNRGRGGRGQGPHSQNQQ